MYHEHFGLSGPPFQFNPAPDAIYLGKEHREGLALLEWGMTNEPSGLTALMGETGTGKTTLVFTVLAQHYANVRAAYMGNPKLGFDEMMREALEQLGIQADGGSKRELIKALAASLDRLGPDERIALLFDEAQELPDEALEELRLLSNVDVAAERRLQIMLVGQPELAERLSAPKARSLNGRIGARAILNPLEQAEARAYVEHRVRQKGSDASTIFVPRALSYLLAHSGGLPRRINVLCHNAMLLAYGEGRTRVEIAAAKEAVAAYEDFLVPGKQPDARMLRPQASHFRLPGPLMALALSGLMLGAAFGASYVVSPGRHNAGSARTVTSEANGVARDVMTTSAAPPLTSVAKFGSDETPILFQRTPSSAHASTNRTGSKPVAVSKDAAAARPVKSDAPRDVRVRHDDTLTNIATRYLGSPDEVGRLIAANPQLNDIDRIYPGEVIHLPAVRSATAQR